MNTKEDSGFGNGPVGQAFDRFIASDPDWQKLTAEEIKDLLKDMQQGGLSTGRLIALSASLNEREGELSSLRRASEKAHRLIESLEAET